MKYSWDAELFGWAVLIITIWLIFGNEMKAEYSGYMDYKKGQDICQKD